MRFRLLTTLGGVGAFLVASFTVGQYVVFRIIRWVNDVFRSEFAVITAILVIMGLMALITYGLGVQTVLGAFVAGILIGQSPILTEHIRNQLRGLVSALFMPVFFGQAGISVDLSILGRPQLLGLTAAIVAIASVGKFSGAFLGGKLSGMSMRQSLAIGCGMNARGSTEVIVATIGLSMAVLTQSLFTMIVTMAVITTMAMPPMLRAALLRVPIGEEEKARLEREELDARGFVAKLERLALAVDDSPAGKFAARLAGYRRRCSRHAADGAAHGRAAKRQRRAQAAPAGPSARRGGQTGRQRGCGRGRRSGKGSAAGGGRHHACAWQALHRKPSPNCRAKVSTSSLSGSPMCARRMVASARG